MTVRPFAASLVGVALFAAAAPPAASEPARGQKSDAQLAQEDRMRELERKVDLLSAELARTREDMAVPEEGGELQSVFGMGPAASKIYGIGRGLSIGGYAEGRYSAIVGDKRRSGETNEIDFVRAVLYAGYKFTDRILFNSEIEFEHASTEEGGAVSVEFAALDFLIRDEVNARAGLLLVPVGFLNEIHEPPFYYGTHRPEVERRILPSTWRENGAGLFGTLGGVVDYKLYAIASLDASGFSPSGLRDGRQQGSESLAEDMAFVGRVDVRPCPQLTVGGSLFAGNTGQDQSFNGAALPDAQLFLWEAHSELRTHGLKARGLVTMAHLDEAGALSRALMTAGPSTPPLAAGQAIANAMLGVYGELGYEVLQWLAPQSEWTVEPFFRYEFVDTQSDVPSGFTTDKTQEFEVYTVGLHVKPIPNVVLKMDYRNRVARRGELGDEFNLGIGLVF